MQTKVNRCQLSSRVCGRRRKACGGALKMKKDSQSGYHKIVAGKPGYRTLEFKAE